MKLSTRLNLSILLFLVIPLIGALLWLTMCSSGKLTTEARAKLAADLKVARLMLQHEINEFQNLAAAAATHQGLGILVEYELHQKLDRQLQSIQQTHRLDTISVLSVQDGRQHPVAGQALSNRLPAAGLDMRDSTPGFTAAAPLFNRHGLSIGALLIRKPLDRTTLLEEIAHETGAEVRIGLDSRAPDPGFLTDSVSLTDNQGEPIATLELRKSLHDFQRDRRTLFAIVATIGCCGLLLLVLLHQSLLQGMIRPILRLKQAANAIGRGEYTTRVSVSGSTEIQELSAHFNDMAEQIQAAWQQCSRLNEDLEEKVATRTAELHQSNQELTHALETLHATQQQLIAKAKLAGLGELSAGLAHELKNPLHYIHQFSQLVLKLLRDLEAEVARETPHPKERDYLFTRLPEFARNIQEHNNRAVRIINDMLEQSRGSAGVRKPANINQTVKEAVNLAYHGMRSQEDSVSITLQEQYADELEERLVSILSGDLTRAVLNLTVNACQAVTRQCHVVNGEYVPTLRISTETNEQGIEIGVWDNGDGIPEEYLDKIFQPFFSAGSPGEGTGLGLSIAHEIVVNLHQGTLEVDSHVGEGTEFLIRLPAS